MKNIARSFFKFLVGLVAFCLLIEIAQAATLYPVTLDQPSNITTSSLTLTWDQTNTLDENFRCYVVLASTEPLFSDPESVPDFPVISTLGEVGLLLLAALLLYLGYKKLRVAVVLVLLFSLALMVQQRLAGAALETPWSSNCLMSKSDTSYDVTDLADGITYYFKIYVVGKGHLIYVESNEVNVTMGTSQYSIFGKVMKGVVKNATLRIYELATDGSQGSQMASTTVDSQGEFSTTGLNRSSTGCYLFEVTGGTYKDEVTGGTVTLEASDKLQAVTCDLSALSHTQNIPEIAITPLTTMAAARAMALAAGSTSLWWAVSTSNVGVAQQYFIQSTLGGLPVDPTEAANVRVALLESRRYGIILAGMAHLANSLGVRALDLVNALAQDASDGTLDGKVNSSTISIPLLIGGTTTLAASAGTTDLQQSIDAFLASGINLTGITEVNIASGAGQIGLNTAGKVYITSTQLPAWTSGQEGSIILKAGGGTGPYTWQLVPGSLPAGFTFSEKGVIYGLNILVSGSTMSISTPFTVLVTDSSTPPTTMDLELRITIVEPPPVISISTCSTATVDESYGGCTVATATGGVPPYYYTLETMGGFPPMGLTLGTGGMVSGTPTVTGIYTFGVCVVDSIGSQDCANATITVVETPATLTVSKSGNGSGTVTSSPSGIDCGSTCTASFDNGTSVTITATPAGGSTFAGWSGDCSGTGTCTLTMSADKAVTANFTVTDGGPATIESVSCVVGAMDWQGSKHATLTAWGTASTTVSEANLYLYSNPAQAYFSSTADCGGWTGTFHCAKSSGDSDSIIWSVERDLMLPVDYPQYWPQTFVADLRDSWGMVLAMATQDFSCQ